MASEKSHSLLAEFIGRALAPLGRAIRCNRKRFPLLSLTLLLSCASTSPRQENAIARYEEYKSAMEYYAETERDYLTLLSNLERYPKDEFLLMRKQILRKELEQNRILMLQARSEFDEAVQDWDIAVQKMETGFPPDSVDLRQIFGLPRPRNVDSIGY